MGYVLYGTKCIYCLRFLFFSYLAFPNAYSFCCLLDSANRNREYIANNHYTRLLIDASFRGDPGVRWCWVNFSAGASWWFGSDGARAYCACGWCGRGLFGRFCSRLSFLFFLPLWQTARYRLIYCLKGVRPKTTNQMLPF